MNCAVGGDIGVRRYACGTKEVAGAEGTWRDAEDGELQGNPIAQGSVDSTLGLSLTVPARGSAEAAYWMAAGRDFREVATIDKVVREKSPGELLRRTRNYWRLWVHKDQRGLDGLPELVVQRYNQSLLIIRSQIDHDGAITAANDTDIIGFARDTYSYMWPRDGALVAAALMRAGHVGAPEKFLQFCSHVISPLGYVRHKYNPDGTLASSWHGYVRDGKPVLPIQEDETRSEEHTSELQSRLHLVCRLLLEKKKKDQVRTSSGASVSFPMLTRRARSTCHYFVQRAASCSGTSIGARLSLC